MFRKNSRSQIVFRTDIFRKLTLGAPDISKLILWLKYSTLPPFVSTRLNTNPVHVHKSLHSFAKLVFDKNYNSLKGALHVITGSRGDVFVVRTSKPAENLKKMGYFDRVTVSLHIL